MADNDQFAEAHVKGAAVLEVDAQRAERLRLEAGAKFLRFHDHLLTDNSTLLPEL